MLRYLTHVDGHDHVALVATTRAADSDEDRGLGVGRFIRVHEEPTVAEVAITVRDDYQGKGLGSLLALTLARAARERGVRHFRGEVLADNAIVRRLLDDVGADLRPQEGNSIAFDIAIADEPPSGGHNAVVARRLLHAAADYLVGALRRLTGTT